VPTPDSRETPSLPRRKKLIWAVGSLGDNYAGNTLGQLKDPVYTVALGVSPELVGWTLAVPRFLDAFFDLFVGHWSDQCRSRWGRRRPFIFVGAIALALTMALLWRPPQDPSWSSLGLAAYLLFATMLFYTAYSLFLVPYRALGLEQTQDYHDRTRLQAWGMAIGLVGGLGLPWLYKLVLFFGAADEVGPTREAILRGAGWVGLGIAAVILVTGLVPAIGCREPVQPQVRQKLNLRGTFGSALGNRPFLQMLGMNFFAIIGMFAPVTVSLLIGIYFLYDGHQDSAATLIGFAGMAQMGGSLLGVWLTTQLCQRLGKRATALVALATSALGHGSLWFTLTPAHPYWSLGSYLCIGWGMQGVWLVSASMNADVCDYDELNTGHRREALYGAVFAVEQKIALATAAILGGYVASLCGYRPNFALSDDVIAALRLALVATPVLGMAAAALCIRRYPISGERLAAIQRELAARNAAAVR
jgi:GPH family glycoside/pentoside/hexuronide:cation symporter